MNETTLPRASGRDVRSWIEHPWAVPALIFMLALIVRAIVALHLPDRILWPDGLRYYRVADNLLQQGGFGSLRDNRFSVPTQPVLIAAVRLLCGDRYIWLRLFFCLIGAASCLIGYALARRLFGPTVALLAGAGLALYPHYVYMSALFEYPQTFFILAMSITFLAYYHFVRSRRLPALAVSGLFLGLGILSVPTALLFAPALLLCLFLGEHGRWRWYAPAVLLLAVSVPVASWTARNYVRYGEVILVNRGGGFAFWTANNATYYQLGKKAVTPPCTPEYRDVSFCLELRAIQKQVREEDLSEAAGVARTDQLEWASGARFFRTSLGRSAAFSVRKFLQFWSPRPDAVRTDGSYGGSFGIWVAILSYTPVLVLGAIGIGACARRWRELLPIYAYIGVFTAAYSVFLPTTRYRLPLDFFLILFSARALSLLPPLARQRTAV